MGKTSPLFSRLAPYLLLLPALTYLALLVGYPVLHAVILSLTEEGSLTLTHFKRMIEDIHFAEALKFTFLLAGIIIPIQILFAIAVSLLLYSRFRGSNICLYIFLIPLAISDVAAALIWYNILAGSGYLNKILLRTGIVQEPIFFFGYAYRRMEVVAIVITEIWRATAIVFVIIFAGLQMIGRDYLEAADIFGATTLQKLRYIILPMLKPSIQSAIIIRTLFAMQVFAVVWILAGRDIPILAGEAYYWQSEIRNPHVASCYALLVAGFSILLGYLYIKLLKPKYMEGGR